MNGTLSNATTARSGSWLSLVRGQRVNIVKLAPDGAQAARYDGEVVATIDQESWLVVAAVWTYRELEIDGLRLCPGDLLLEWFSPEQMFNAFAVFSPQRAFRGWYANVTMPAFMRCEGEEPHEPILYWQDLYLDLIGLPDGQEVTRDQDELDASGLAASNPELHQRILEAADAMRDRFRRRSIPFMPNAQLLALLDVCHYT
jgi:hypothetical protein